MRMSSITICYILSLICFVLGFFEVGKLSWLEGGLAFLVLSLLVK